MEKLVLLTIFCLLGSWSVLADPGDAAKSRQEFCSHKDDPNYFKELASRPQNQIAFVNPHAGLGNGGLCWWHSQLQGSSLFLTVYRPDLAKPKGDEVSYIFEAIMKTQAVIEIPGYSNFSDFTADNEKLLIQLLADWQISQGVFGFGFVDGIAADSMSAASLRADMDDLFDRVENKKEITYQVLKMPGLEAHAWLVVHMTRNSLGGYHLQVLDSNFSGLQDYDYSPGQTSFAYTALGVEFAPRTHREGDLSDYQELMTNYCSGNVDPSYKLYKIRNSNNVRQPQVGDLCGDGKGHNSKFVVSGESSKLVCDLRF